MVLLMMMHMLMQYLHLVVLMRMYRPALLLLLMMMLYQDLVLDQGGLLDVSTPHLIICRYIEHLFIKRAIYK